MSYLPQGKVAAYREAHKPICSPILGVKSDDWVVDHDHSSGEIRGVISRQANTLIGKMENAFTSMCKGDPTELPTVLENIASYLRQPDSEILHPVGLNQLTSRFKNNLKKDVTLFVLFDCCHSGTILDLKYQYLDSTNYDTVTENDVNLETNGDVFMISGCMDAQTSADAYINSMYQGAMSWALLDTINNLINPTWKEVITKMRNTLKSSKFTQIPQLSSGKALDLDAKFCLV